MEENRRPEYATTYTFGEIVPHDEYAPGQFIPVARASNILCFDREGNKSNVQEELLNGGLVPKPTAGDAGKFLRVNDNLKYALVTIPEAEEEEF